MKHRFPFKRIVFALSIIFLYSVIIGIVGNCNDLEVTKSVAAVDNTSKENVSTLDLYFAGNESPLVEQPVTTTKAQISDYSVFNDYTRVTTVTTTLPKTVVQIKPKTTKQQSVKKPDPSNPPAPHSGDITMTVTINGVVQTLPAYDVLCSLVQQELNSAHIEAIKAQAVATYTYFKYYESQGRYISIGLLSMDKVNPTVKSAVSQVLGVAIYYKGQYINASYFSSSGGATASAKDVYGTDVPYLRSVPSEYDYKNDGYYKKTVTLSYEEVKKRIEKSCGIVLADDPTTWFEFLPKEKGGLLDGDFIGKMLIHTNTGTITRTGRQMREVVLGMDVLRSSKFDVTYNNGNFIFTSYGNGHGVGLSQIGADLYAKNAGYKYDQILKHYYTGVEVK